MERLRALSEVLGETDRHLAAGESAAAKVWPTGFGMLDTYLSGGLRSGELTLLGGPQGLGKTSFALQVLRKVVSCGESGVYFSFEHDEQTVLTRLIALEMLEMSGGAAPPVHTIRTAMERRDSAAGSLAQRLADAGGDEALRRIASYGDRLLIHRSTGFATDLDAIRTAMLEAAEATGLTPLVVIDYLQKVAGGDRSRSEDERVAAIVEGLKDIALEHDLPVLAIVAVDKEGLASSARLRTHHLRGSSALAYEPDVVLIMNEKFDVVARHHLVYDVGNAERFRNWVVISVEKNRSGRDHIDIEIMKRFEHGGFDTSGRRVSEQLVDERIYTK